MTTVYFATNRTQPRRRGQSFGNRFNTDGPHFYEVGRAEVTWKRTSRDGQVLDWDDYDVTWEVAKGRRPDRELPSGVPEMHRKRSARERTGSSRILQELRDEMRRDGRDALVFIHGFANSFESSIARAAQLKETYRIASADSQEGEAEPYKPHVFAFSWPSDGMVQPPWKYASDREDAALSGVAMARALRRFVEFLDEGEPCPGRLHLVAHSMGNWALRHAVLGFRALVAGSRLPKLFDHALLMAADEDEDCFEHANKLALLPELVRQIHVYHSSDDLALEVSDKIKFNMDRLGTDGPRTFSGINARISAIDCGKVDYTELDHGNHQYYRLRQEVTDDVRHVLSGQFRPDEVPGRDIIEPGRRYRIRSLRDSERA